MMDMECCSEYWIGRIDHLTANVRETMEQHQSQTGEALAEGRLNDAQRHAGAARALQDLLDGDLRNIRKFSFCPHAG